jgi:hypothetical protein
MQVQRTTELFLTEAKNKQFPGNFFTTSLTDCFDVHLTSTPESSSQEYPNHVAYHLQHGTEKTCCMASVDENDTGFQVLALTLMLAIISAPIVGKLQSPEH